jgi:putative oxidoreductase
VGPFVVPTVAVSVVLLLVRVILSVTFFNECYVKFKDLKGFAKRDGVPLPAAGFVATAELCAALGMISGVLSQWAGVGLVLLMLSTISLHLFKWHSPYWAAKRGWEYDLIMLTLASVIAVFGPGQFALMPW